MKHNFAMLLSTTTFVLLATNCWAQINQGNGNETTSSDNAFSPDDFIIDPPYYRTIYIVEAEISVRQILQSERPQLESRLKTVLLAAYKQSTNVRLRLNFTSKIISEQPTSADSQNPFRVEILQTQQKRGSTLIEFVVFFEEEPVEADIIANDLSLLTLSYISATLQYPVIKINAQSKSVENYESRSWVIIVILLTSGLLILFCGWFLLFLYYNTCGRPIPKYENPPGDLNESSKPGTTRSSQGTKLKIPEIIIEEDEISSEYDAQKPTSRSQSVDATMPKESSSSPANDVQNKKSEVVERTLSNESENLKQIDGANDEKTLALSNAKTTESVSHVAETQTQTANSNKKPPGKTDDIVSIGDCDVVPWLPYQAGDFVASTFGVKARINEHPRPGATTSTGIIELVTLNHQHS